MQNDVCIIIHIPLFKISIHCVLRCFYSYQSGKLYMLRNYVTPLMQLSLTTSD